jgi:alpha-ketoglutarate-dependent taurine dioxygenase
VTGPPGSNKETAVEVRALSELGGVEVKGIDLSRAQTPKESRALATLYDEHGLVVFRDQHLTKQQLVQAAWPFGGPMIDVPGAARHDEAPGISIVSTRGADGTVMPEDPDAIVGELEWHTDQGFVTVPSRGKILYAVEVPPEGGETGFIDGQVTYAALPDETKARIQGLHVIQSWTRAESYMARNRAYRIDGERAMAANKFPPVAYPIVMPHPITGRIALNLPPIWADGIVELPGEEGDALVAELIAHIKQPRFQYWHRYRPGDAVIWDNWRMLHAASGTPGRHARTLWGIMVKGGPVVGREIA